MKILLGLGSNLGDRWTHLRAAVQALRRLANVRVLAVSGVYETPPWGDGGAESAPYLNACVCIDAGCSVDAVLGACLGIEAALGRLRVAGQQFAPRVLDIDVLFACEQDRVVQQTSVVLTLPHPRLAQRAFALKPAIALWSHPQLQDWYAAPQVQQDAPSVRLLAGEL